jgi:methanogenic corrinoid protein MtbC1
VLPGGEFERFLKLILGGNKDEVVAAFLDDLLHRGHSTESVFADLLAPAARRLGEMWEEDISDFAEVTLACCQMQRVIRRLGRTVGLGRIPGTRGDVLVMTLPDEQHTLGAVVVAELLGRNGWSVSLGRPFNPDPPQGNFALLAFSLARVDQWAAARDLIADARRQYPGIQVMVGGSAFLTEPGLVSRVGADGWAEDGKALTALADRLSGTSPDS